MLGLSLEPSKLVWPKPSAGKGNTLPLRQTQSSRLLGWRFQNGHSLQTQCGAADKPPETQSFRSKQRGEETSSGFVWPHNGSSSTITNKITTTTAASVPATSILAPLAKIQDSFLLFLSFCLIKHGHRPGLNTLFKIITMCLVLLKAYRVDH